MNPAKYLVTRPYRNSGLGANLLSMAAALHACELGLHVHSGNGEFAAGSQYWNRVNTSIFERDSFVERLRRACQDCVRRLPAAVQSEWSVFVATDSLEMQQRLLKMPEAFALRQQFPAPGAGHQFADFDDARYAGYTDVESMNETIVDMFMLAECQGSCATRRHSTSSLSTRPCFSAGTCGWWSVTSSTQ